MAHGQLGDYYLVSLFRTVLRHSCRAKDGGDFLVNMFLDGHRPCLTCAAYNGFVYTLRFTIYIYISLEPPTSLELRERNCGIVVRSLLSCG